MYGRFVRGLVFRACYKAELNASNAISSCSTIVTSQAHCIVSVKSSPIIVRTKCCATKLLLAKL